MDRQYSWKRTEEMEIDLTDLIRRLCGRWKQIAVCGLAAALILGGAGWYKSREALDTAVTGILEEIVMTEAEEQGVADAVRLENEIRDLEAYIDHSLLMQMDPYHKTRYIMLYCIESDKMLKLPAITESYLNFVCNGGAADALMKHDSRWVMDKSCLAELLTGYQKTYSFPYHAVVDESADSLDSEQLFYVEVTGRNASEAERLALDVQAVIKEYSAEIKEMAGIHRLALVSCAESMTADSALQSLQHDKKALLSSNKGNLKTMTDAFSEEQMSAFKEASGTEDGEEDVKQAASIEYETGETDYQRFRTVVKYMLLGLAGGIFLYCGIFSAWYACTDTVKSMEEMKRRYAFSVYGGILLESSSWKDSYGCTQEQVQKRLGLACKKQEVTKLCAVSDVSLGVLEKECLEHIACQLREWGIDMSLAENASSDTSVWDSLEESGSVLLVCKTGKTTHRMIDDAMMFYGENRISVIGAVAI